MPCHWWWFLSSLLPVPTLLCFFVYLLCFGAPGSCLMFWSLFRSYRVAETQLASLVVVLSRLALQRVTDPSCRVKADLHDEGKKKAIYPSQICNQCRCRLHS